MSGWIHDITIAIRQLRRRPGFALLAVATLALGMGVNAVAFTFVNGVFLRGFTAHVVPDTLRVSMTPAGEDGGLLSFDEFQRFDEALSAPATLAAEGRLGLSWLHDGGTTYIHALAVSRDYFTLVTPPVRAGRVVVSIDDDAPSVVIGERFWRDTLGAPSLTGLRLLLNGVQVEVSGIIAREFTGPAGTYSPDVWIPLDELTLLRTSPTLRGPDERWLFAIARPGPSQTMTALEAQLAAISIARDARADTGEPREVAARPLGEVWSATGNRAAALVMGTIGLVLLLACFNVANQLLARAIERERDMGVRTALGASRWRLLRQMSLEGLLFASLAGIVATLLAWWTTALLTRLAPPLDTPQWVDLRPDARVITFLVGVIALAGVLPGLWPAISASRVDVVRALAGQGGWSGGRPSPVRRWLVGAQVAGATTFLVLAVLFVQSFSALQSANTGLAQDELLVAEFAPASHGYTAERAAAYVDVLTARARALPGVVDVAVADRAPFFLGADRSLTLWPDGRTCSAVEPCETVTAFAVSAGYFRTAGARLAEGQDFSAAGVAAGSEVIVNGPLAWELSTDGAVIGRTLRLGVDGRPRTIVGVVAPIKMRGLDRDVPTVFLPLDAGTFAGDVALLLRASRPAGLTQPLLDAAYAIDSNVALRVQTLASRLERQLWPVATLRAVFGGCALLALALATSGLASVILHAMSRRRREFALRIAVGASARDIATEVFRSGLDLLWPGLVAGLALAAATARVTRAAFVGVDVLSPTAYLLVAALLLAVALAACAIPALRSSRTAPLLALRQD
ncbi:MAG: ABC transporter permease [Acidobacteria bacterium]|nr:ABC transporter permease [Acidobacteriota bacterium]